MIKACLKICLCLSLLSANLTHAADTEVMETFADEMVVKHGFNRAQLLNWLAQAKVLNTVLKLTAPSTNKKGKPRAWYLYRKNFVTQTHINAGVEFWQEHAATLQRAERTYGVPASIILAILGVETIYGRHMGNFRTMDTLVTLGFYHPTRSEYFRTELEHFLLLARDAGIDPFKIRGSYAGAMGMSQFMPSSYRQFAVDFDGDGKINLWTNADDAIGSIANYFRQYGWQPGKTIIVPTEVRAEMAETLANLDIKPERSIQELRGMGVLYSGNEPDDTLSSVVELQFETGMTYWLAFQNFYVITRYNHSKRYAMSVYELAREISESYAQNN